MRIGNYQFKPGLLTTIIALVFLVILVRLGIWQLDRAEEKRQIIANQQAKMSMPPVNLTRAVQDYEALAFPGAFQSVGGIAGNLSEIAVYDLPRDYFNQYIERILAVTQADVQQVARKYIVPEQMLVVVVGDRASIEEEIRALGLGPVRVLSIEDVLGPKPDLGGM